MKLADIQSFVKENDSLISSLWSKLLEDGEMEMDEYVSEADKLISIGAVSVRDAEIFYDFLERLYA